MYYVQINEKLNQINYRIAYSNRIMILVISTLSHSQTVKEMLMVLKMSGVEHTKIGPIFNKQFSKQSQ